MPTLLEVGQRVAVAIEAVDGERGFRRRLLELGLCPGTTVRVTNVAPLGDPLEIEVRGGRLSIRRDEAAQIRVRR
ncbi:MAG: ferrous iron transport protein A [Kofleriaceae bacterium]|jgi:Fe2+ transport system protein FeoA|nr:ferrous iron transport protein A [Kofleriaceae bacterium]MBP9172531.1 ferrous iron transport protein A [Kofleriaceae bacterium]MBP9863373.1 ferrous iron transport protein A [Kofleriaceae bacterium]